MLRFFLGSGRLGERRGGRVGEEGEDGFVYLACVSIWCSRWKLDGVVKGVCCLSGSC